MNLNITFTAAASLYIEQMLEKKQGSIGFRLSIKKTGCSGYSYLPTLIEAINPGDIEWVTENGIKIFIDSAWTHYLQGLQVDYVEEEKSGLKQKRLVFINPNEKTRCGCGESFQI